jgi:hypothetical protein
MTITYVILVLMGGFLLAKWGFFVYCRQKVLPMAQLDIRFIAKLNGGDGSGSKASGTIPQEPSNEV